MSLAQSPARLAAAAALAAFAVAWTPNAATADTLSGVTGAVGLVRPVADTASTVVLQRDGDIVTYPAELLQMQRGAAVIPGYSLSPDTAVRRSSPFSDSIAPSALGADQLGKIDWILASVPAVAPGLPGGLPALPGGLPAVPGGLPGGLPGLPGGLPAAPGGLPVGGLPVGGLPVGGLPVGGLPVGALPVGGQPAGGLPVGALPVGRHSGKGRSAARGVVPALPGALPAVPGGIPAVPGDLPAVGSLPGATDVARAVSGLGMPKLLSGMTPAQRSAATQAAIWHYSAGTDMVFGRNAAQIEALYRMLTGTANRGLPLPTPTLMSAPDDDAFGNVRGTAGELMGPFTVDPALDNVLMTLDGPAGLRLVDDAGKPLRTFHGGQRFFLDVPRSTPPGQAVLTAVGAPRTTALGRVVRGITTGDPGQMLVLADRRALPAQQTSVARWAAGGLGKDVGAAPTCVGEGIGVELDNARRQVPLKALVDQRPVTVPAGATKVVPVRVPEGEHYDIPVSDGTRTTHLTGVRHCTKMTPVLTAAPDCAVGGMGVTVVNDDPVRDAVLAVNGKVVRVAGEATKTVHVPVKDGKKYDIQVLGQDGYSRAFNGVRSCDVQTRLAAAQTESPAAAALPVTGAALGGILAGGVALLGGGALALFLTRRRRARTIA